MVERMLDGGAEGRDTQAEAWRARYAGNMTDKQKSIV